MSIVSIFIVFIKIMNADSLVYTLGYTVVYTIAITIAITIVHSSNKCVKQ